MRTYVSQQRLDGVLEGGLDEVAECEHLPYKKPHPAVAPDESLPVHTEAKDSQVVVRMQGWRDGRRHRT